ncbi:GNAT family N-acetyltransferase [Paracidovorax anthurii]|uniref:Acetyltransferase (GNAT) family protein n=1 Tax=Paracidovorax anthurii TaxID=78229 RepID=A0A328Z3N3_9BURK|nr:GNAT family N-acetyltransferase [Paracidovorax anthurii]RAR76866.1 acetyltransferase (GNAT) family protein [Paracidovorax anthurii]
MGGFTLRLSNMDDIERLSLISARARGRYSAVPPLAHIAYAPPLSADRFKACRVEVAVDGASQAVVGFAAMRPLDGLLYLDNISVEPGASGRGIGKVLLSSVMEHATALEAPAVTLTTFKVPIWNGPWFRKHGFRPMPSDRIGAGLRAVMERQWQTLDPAARETLWLPL